MSDPRYESGEDVNHARQCLLLQKIIHFEGADWIERVVLENGVELVARIVGGRAVIVWHNPDQ